MNSKQPNIPEIFRNPSETTNKIMKGLKNDILNELQDTAIKDENVEVTRMPNYISVTKRQLEKQGVIDMKQYFAKSSKRKPKKNGGWYLVIPIRVKTSKMRPTRIYNQLNSVKPTGRITNTLTDYLKATGKPRRSSVSNLNPKAPSRNISKIQQGKKSSYVMFRTVSNLSPPSSWIVNRDKVNRDNFSKTTLENVRRMMNWQVKNLGK